MKRFIKTWVKDHPLTPSHIDCATSVMLKILDGKCKMDRDEKLVMSLLYDQVKALPGELLGPEIRELIAEARQERDEAMKLHIYEKRVLAETMISRPMMKGFKAMIREQGLFDALNGETNHG